MAIKLDIFSGIAKQVIWMRRSTPLLRLIFHYKMIQNQTITGVKYPLLY
ncbi:MAG: hypothetical protein V4553_07780 [Bacteroidota bacterium]